MQAVNDFFTWLFNDRMGVLALVVGGIFVALVVAFVLERRTRERYTNHEKSPDDWSLFDDEDGWSENEADNN